MSKSSAFHWPRPVVLFDPSPSTCMECGKAIFVTEQGGVWRHVERIGDEA